jgi:hypothetical protein
MIGAVMVEGIRSAGRIGERHIGVRSEQVDGISRQAGRLVFPPPVEYVQRHTVAVAPVRQFGPRRTIDMDLPGHRREGLEIVLSVYRDPRQPVPAVDMTGGASA